MLDAQNAPAAPAAIQREDYRPPDWLVPEIALDFSLDAARTIVRATLKVTRWLILDNAERYPLITQHFRDNNLIQIDMIGHGPQHSHVTSTSLFLRRFFDFPPAQQIQPHHGPGMIESVQVMPKHLESNKPGSF